MKNEHNHKQMPSPEDFWPEAKALLDSHFAKKRKLFLLFGVGSVLIITTIGLAFLNSTKNTSKANLNHANIQRIAKINQSNNSIVENTTKPELDKVPVNNSDYTISQSASQNEVIKSDKENEIYATKNFATNNINSSKNTSTNNQEIVNTASLNNPITAENIVTIDAERPYLISFLKIPLLSFKSVENKYNVHLKEIKELNINTDNDEYFENKKTVNYFIGAYAGLQMVNKQIKAIQSLTEYADIRNTTENKINTLYFGLNFTIEKKGFMLQSGFEYNSVGEQNNYEAKSKQWLQNDEKVWDVYNRQIIKVDTIYHFGIVNYNQTIINIKDSTLLTKSDSVFVYHTDSNIVKANSKTSISYLEIPVMIGYQFKFGKASIAPFAGISVGYLTRSNGMYVNKSITGIEEINNGNLITTFNFNYQLKLQLAYNLNGHLMFVLSPQYRNNLFSVSPRSSGINTKYSALGTSIGMIYKL